MKNSLNEEINQVDKKKKLKLQLEKDMLLRRFGDNLSKLIRDKGWTQDKFAIAIGISRKSLTDYFNYSNPKQPKLDTLVRIAEKLEVSIDSLVGIKIKPVAAKDEVRLSMENLYFILAKLNTSVALDYMGRTSITLNNKYLSEFINTAWDKGANSIEEINEIFTDLHGEEQLAILAGEILSMREMRTKILDAYIHFIRLHGDLNGTFGAMEDDQTIVEKFNEEFMKRNLAELKKWYDDLNENIVLMRKPWNPPYLREGDSLIPRNQDTPLVELNAEWKASLTKNENERSGDEVTNINNSIEE